MIGDTIVGEIVNVSPSGEATIKATISLDDYTRKGYRKVLIYLQDSREISDKQRKFCYALISDIADWQGDHERAAGKAVWKEYLKLKYIVDDLEPLARRMFSLSNAPVDIINGFLRFLIDFILENDIPTKKSLLEYVDENSIKDYIYSCLINKKCCICGKPCDLHHADRIGLGGNREEVIHEGLEVLPLCRTHHQEVHSKGDPDFYKLYHLDGGITCDKTIIKIYHLKSKKENNK